MTTTSNHAAQTAARVAARVERVRELAAEGKNDIQIADELGVCAATVCRDRNRNGIAPGFDPAKTRVTEHGTPGMWRRCNCGTCTAAASAKHAAYVRSVAGRIAETAHNTNKRWTEQDDAIVMDESLSVRDAALRLQRSWHSVTARRHKLRALARTNA